MVNLGHHMINERPKHGIKSDRNCKDFLQLMLETFLTGKEDQSEKEGKEEAFKPERFLPEKKDNMNQYIFLSFVVGPRNCIGMRFALLEAKLVMTKIIQNFNAIKSDKTAIPLEFQLH